MSLWNQTKGKYVPGQEVEAKVYTKDIAFNVIPHILTFLWTTGPQKKSGKWLRKQKRLSTPEIKVTATCVRVPVFVGHSEAINIEFEDFIDEDEVSEKFYGSPQESWLWINVKMVDT